ncbi:hypothetical protein BKA67DRAFT_157927 [Truncatella angustata]|uniref:Uncharacterized protein n=1 Tax=Truncatella angustata TaxID=152316 RepID=A0A9P8UQG8_9PEZI|nr:uncharacterized protein BKA67DRAFT_157927 [Truncatella angustata]KAH6656488.1 hypothetical protein BKA67DRAFT_157927 [Truncatella angustata]
MCRLILFAGSCTQCGGEFSWDELAQQLPCLEAKNSGMFGECRNGVNMDQHTFDQECDSCLEAGGGEGYGDTQTNNKKGDDRGKKRQRTG